MLKTTQSWRQKRKRSETMHYKEHERRNDVTIKWNWSWRGYAGSLRLFRKLRNNHRDTFTNVILLGSNLLHIWLYVESRLMLNYLSMSRTINTCGVWVGCFYLSSSVGLSTFFLPHWLGAIMMKRVSAIVICCLTLNCSQPYNYAVPLSLKPGFMTSSLSNGFEKLVQGKCRSSWYSFIPKVFYFYQIAMAYTVILSNEFLYK